MIVIPHRAYNSTLLTLEARRIAQRPSFSRCTGADDCGRRTRYVSWEIVIGRLRPTLRVHVLCRAGHRSTIMVGI